MPESRFPLTCKVFKVGIQWVILTGKVPVKRFKIIDNVDNAGNEINEVFAKQPVNELLPIFTVDKVLILAILDGIAPEKKLFCRLNVVRCVN